MWRPPLATEPGSFKQVGERKIWQGHVISLTEVEIESPDGERFSREVVRHPGAVVVVPILGDQVVLTRQYRAAVNGELLELPAGKRDVLDEDPELTAQRELEEEVGYRAGRLTLLARWYNSPGFTDEFSYCFLAEALTPGDASPQGPEERSMEIVKVPLVDVSKLVASGELTDGKTILGLSLATWLLGN